MSWGVQSQCWNCEKAGTCEDKCHDTDKIQDAVNKLNMEPHQGSGTVIISCNKMISKTK